MAMGGGLGVAGGGASWVGGLSREGGADKNQDEIISPGRFNKLPVKHPCNPMTAGMKSPQTQTQSHNLQFK